MEKFIVEKFRDYLGEFGVGDKIDSERRLSAMFSISRNLVREILLQLEYEGLVSKKHGVGYFVSPRSNSRDISVIHRDDIERDVISFEVGMVFNLLIKSKNCKCYLLKRRKFMNDKLLEYQVIYFNKFHFKKINTCDATLSIIDILKCYYEGGNIDIEAICIVRKCPSWLESEFCDENVVEVKYIYKNVYDEVILVMFSYFDIHKYYFHYHEKILLK